MVRNRSEDVVGECTATAVGGPSWVVKERF
jgi:hypothetical protein